MKHDDGVAIKRMDIAAETVLASKRAFALRSRLDVNIDSSKDLEKVYFREVLDYAVNRFATTMEKELLKIGLVRRDLQQRQRPVTNSTWDGPLERLSKKFDISKIQLCRAFLEMLAAAEGQQAPLKD